MSSTSGEVRLLILYKKSLLEFIDLLIEWLPQDQDVLMMRIMVADQLLIEDVMDRFITHVYPYREQIMQEREEYFLSDPQIFNTVKDQSRVLSLKRLWTDPKFTAEDKQRTWEWMKLFVGFVDKYLKFHPEKMQK